MEQFIYALTSEGDITIKKSSGVDSKLRLETLRELYALQEDDQKWHSTEQCITISTVKLVSDNFRRKGVFNHTLVIPIMEYLGYTQPSRLLSEHKWNGGQIPAKLEAIKL